MDAPTLLALGQVIASVATLVAAIGTVVISLRTFDKVEVVHKATNSMKDALVKAVGEQEHAKGVIEGVAKEKAGESK